MTFCNTLWVTSNTLPQTEICHRVRCRVRKLNSRTLGNLATQLLPKIGSVIGVNLSVEACARDGDVAEAGVEQIRVDVGIGVDENAFGRKALGAVTGDSVAVVEMTMLAGVEFDLAVVVEACREATIGMDRLDRGEVAIGNAERFVGRSKLDPVAYGELAVDFLVDADAVEPAGVVGCKLSIRFFDRELIFGWVDRDDRCVGGGFDSDGFAAACVANYVVDLVVAGPGSFGSGHVLTLNQHTEIMIFRRKASIGLQLLANSDVQLAAGSISLRAAEQSF